MILSPAERSYLYESLVQKPPVRPDARSEHQFRPLEAKTSFLPSLNGSARMRLMDGSECIVSVKAKVVLKSQAGSLIECDVDVSGFRDDLNFVSMLRFNMTNLLCQNFPMAVLSLTSKFAYKLFVDCVVISHSSYPLTLLSLTSYLALKTTKLPLLVSDVDDSAIEEQPTFSDDWDNAQLLSSIAAGAQGAAAFNPPIFVTLGVVGDNLLFDPSVEEEQVLENGLILSWHNDRVITPVTNINLALNSNNSNFKGMRPQLVLRGMELTKRYSGEIVAALNALVDQDDGDGRIF
jgi:exosome complex component RRP42